MSGRRRARRVPRRGGITLVEASLFGAVGFGLLALAWGVLSNATRVGGQTEGKIRALEAALLASDRLRRDLEALAEGPGFEVEVHVGLASTRLRLPVAGDAPGEVRPVEYRFDATEGVLSRRVGAAAPRVLPGRFAAFVARKVGRVGAEGPSVHFALVGVGVGEAPGQPAGIRRSVVIGGAAREAAAGAVAYPAWNPVPDPAG